MGIQINGNNDIISALDGSWTAEGASINTSGILTATTFKGNIVGTAATFTGPVTIGGTLTYEDVTNIDSVGIVTARTGVVSPYSDIDDWIDVGSNIKLGNAGVVTATSFVGALPISNESNDRVLTSSGSGAINAEANLSMTGNILTFNTTANSHRIQNVATGNHYTSLEFDSNRSSAGDELAFIDFQWDGDKVADIIAIAGSDTSNKDDGHLVFRTSPSQGSIAERLRIHSSGRISIGNNPTIHSDYILHIEDSGETNIKVEGNTSTLGARISLQNNDTTANSYSQYAFNDAGGQSTSGIRGINTDQTNNYGELAFLTRNAQGTPPQERVRITKDGDLCIGRTSTISNAKLAIHCDATEPAIAVQCNHTNTDTDLITAYNSGGKNIVNITAETDNSPFLKFEILSGNTAVERFRVNHLGNVAIGGGTASNRLEIIDDPAGFPSDSAQPNATLLIKHGTSGSNRRWVGIGASLTGAWLQSSSPGGSGLAAPIAINPGGGKVGINSTNPQHNLDVKGNARVHNADPALYLQSYNNASNTCLIRMGDTGSFQRASISYDLSSGFMMWKLGGAGNNVEHMRYDGANNRLHIGKRDGNSNSTHWSTARVSIVGPDPIATSVTKASSYLAIGNNESELNGVYPITFGYTNNSNSHQPAYIAYKTTNAGSAECGDLLFGTRNVITDTAPTERLRITNDGHINQNLTTPSGTSSYQDTQWYDRDGGKFTLTYSDFNEIKILKLENANDYNRICYRRERMSHNCDIEFDLEGNVPSGSTYRHVGFVINGDGTGTASNFDRMVFRTRPSNANNNQIRLDKGGGGYGFNIQNSNVPAWFDGTSRHIKIQIRRRIFNVFVNGEILYSETTDTDLVRTHGYFGVIIYEAGTTSPWVKLRNFKITNRFTKPQWLARASGVNVDVASGDPFPFNQSLLVSANMSGTSYYNTSTYKYTIPISGTYYIFHRVYRNSSTSAEIAYYVNNNARIRFRPQPSGGDYIFAGSAMLVLDKDDTISVNAYNGQLDNFYGNSSEAFSSWGGHLIE